LLAGHFDADTHVDVMFSAGLGSSGATATVLLGDGTGGFPASRHLVMPYTNVPLSRLVWIALDADGDEDVVAVKTFNMLALLQNDGAANFWRTEVGTGVSILAVATADFDGDGRADFVAVGTDFSAGGYAYTVYRSTGAAVFIHLKTGALSGEGWSVVAGDVNGDGAPDIIVGGAGGCLDVLLAKNY